MDVSDGLVLVFIVGIVFSNYRNIFSVFGIFPLCFIDFFVQKAARCSV